MIKLLEVYAQTFRGARLGIRIARTSVGSCTDRGPRGQQIWDNPVASYGDHMTVEQQPVEDRRFQSPGGQRPPPNGGDWSAGSCRATSWKNGIKCSRDGGDGGRVYWSRRGIRCLLQVANSQVLIALFLADLTLLSLLTDPLPMHRNC